MIASAPKKSNRIPSPASERVQFEIIGVVAANYDAIYADPGSLAEYWREPVDHIVAVRRYLVRPGCSPQRVDDDIMPFRPSDVCGLFDDNAYCGMVPRGADPLKYIDLGLPADAVEIKS